MGLSGIRPIMRKVTLLNPGCMKEVVLRSSLVSHTQSGCPPDLTSAGFMGGLSVAFAGAELIELPAGLIGLDRLCSLI